MHHTLRPSETLRWQRGRALHVPLFRPHPSKLYIFLRSCVGHGQTSYPSSFLLHTLLDGTAHMGLGRFECLLHSLPTSPTPQWVLSFYFASISASHATPTKAVAVDNRHCPEASSPTICAQSLHLPSSFTKTHFRPVSVWYAPNQSTPHGTDLDTRCYPRMHIIKRSTAGSCT